MARSGARISRTNSHQGLPWAKNTQIEARKMAAPSRERRFLGVIDRRSRRTLYTFGHHIPDAISNLGFGLHRIRLEWLVTVNERGLALLTGERFGYRIGDDEVEVLLNK